MIAIAATAVLDNGLRGSDLARLHQPTLRNTSKRRVQHEVPIGLQPTAHHRPREGTTACIRVAETP